MGIQGEFARLFPTHADQRLYRFSEGSSMEPAGTECRKSICDETVVWGDIQVTPFYDIKEVMATIERLVADFNERVVAASTTKDAEQQGGGKECVELSWLGRPRSGEDAVEL